MTRQEVISFLEAIGARNISEGQQWIRCSCPMAHWNHKSKKDDNPSFGIKVTAPDVPSLWHCFTEATGGTLLRLAWNLHQMRGVPLSRRARDLLELELARAAPEVIETHPNRLVVPSKWTKVVVKEFRTYRPVPDSVLEMFPLLGSGTGGDAERKAAAWLVRQRGISEEVIRQFGLRLYHLGDRIGVIFPIITPSGDVVDLRVRYVGTKKMHRLSPELTGSKVNYQASELWFGYQFLTQDLPLILVEGELDALRLVSLGTKNVLAACGEPSIMQCHSLYHHRIWLGFDADEAGLRYAVKVRKWLAHKVEAQLDWSVVGAKDAGDLTGKAQLVKVISKRKVFGS